jgi:hypothetical protein
MRTTDPIVQGFGCLILLGNLVFWGLVIAVAWHFIAKFW